MPMFNNVYRVSHKVFLMAPVPWRPYFMDTLHMFVLHHQNSPIPLKTAFEFALQVALVQCHESNMAFSQQFFFSGKELFGSRCLIYSIKGWFTITREPEREWERKEC